jgi:hypothetical protein
MAIWYVVSGKIWQPYFQIIRNLLRFEPKNKDSVPNIYPIFLRERQTARGKTDTFKNRFLILKIADITKKFQSFLSVL